MAVLLGATTVVLAAGLATSLSRVQAAFSRLSAVQVSVELAGSGGTGGGPVVVPKDELADPAAVRAAIQAQPGTARLVGVSQTEVDLVGSTEPLEVNAYHGDASWVGYQLISGRWYHGPDEAVAGSQMLRLTGTKVGDHITISTELGQRRLHIVGEVFRLGGATIMMDAAGLAGLVERAAPNRFEVARTGGTDPHAYIQALSAAVGSLAVLPQVTADTEGSDTIRIMLGLITTLSLLLAGVAALGVFNTVVLNTRERVHEIGVLKSIGMTPRQVGVMVVTSMVTIGLVGGALAVPLGWVLHRWILPVMGNAAGLGIPDSVLAVYGPVQLVGLGAAGVALAVLGALVPAGWAGRTRVATALRAE
jgi:putative ABC transport system permease protein